MKESNAYLCHLVTKKQISEGDDWDFPIDFVMTAILIVHLTVPCLSHFEMSVTFQETNSHCPLMFFTIKMTNLLILHFIHFQCNFVLKTGRRHTAWERNQHEMQYKYVKLCYEYELLILIKCVMESEI